MRAVRASLPAALIALAAVMGCSLGGHGSIGNHASFRQPRRRRPHRDEVLALAGDGVPVIDIGANVAYPGFIDAHAHWIGDLEYYDLETPAEAIDAAASRGRTPISEQWVDQERLDELESLAADDDLPPRVDAYLALNYDSEFFGDWYESHEPRAVDDQLRVEGLKIHLDDGWGHTIKLNR